MIRLGLTGGIGSGKSTVARMLVELGAALVDADAISRECTAAGGAAISLIAAQFGPGVLTPEGAMNRDVMRQLVFSNSAARVQLEAIIHPIVSRESARFAAVAVETGHALIVFDIPLLVESNRWRQQLCKVMVVDCEESTQISRVVARGGRTKDAVVKVIAQQASREQRLAAADMVIYNEGLTMTQLVEEVSQINKRITL